MITNTISGQQVADLRSINKIMVTMPANQYPELTYKDLKWQSHYYAKSNRSEEKNHATKHHLCSKAYHNVIWQLKGHKLLTHWPQLNRKWPPSCLPYVEWPHLYVFLFTQRWKFTAWPSGTLLQTTWGIIRLQPKRWYQSALVQIN